MANFNDEWLATILGPLLPAGALVRATGVTRAIWMAGLGLAALALLGAILMPQLRRARA